MTRRYGLTGRSTPAILATPDDQAPAAHTTVVVFTRPARVRTAVTAPSRTEISVTGVRVTILAPWRRAARAYPCTMASGVARPSSGDQSAPTRCRVLSSGDSAF